MASIFNFFKNKQKPQDDQITGDIIAPESSTKRIKELTAELRKYSYYKLNSALELNIKTYNKKTFENISEVHSHRVAQVEEYDISFISKSIFEYNQLITQKVAEIHDYTSKCKIFDNLKEKEKLSSTENAEVSSTPSENTLSAELLEERCDRSFNDDEPRSKAESEVATVKSKPKILSDKVIRLKGDELVIEDFKNSEQEQDIDICKILNGEKFNLNEKENSSGKTCTTINSSFEKNCTPISEQNDVSSEKINSIESKIFSGSISATYIGNQAFASVQVVDSESQRKIESEDDDVYMADVSNTLSSQDLENGSVKMDFLDTNINCHNYCNSMDVQILNDVSHENIKSSPTTMNYDKPEEAIRKMRNLVITENSTKVTNYNSKYDLEIFYIKHPTAYEKRTFIILKPVMKKYIRNLIFKSFQKKNYVYRTLFRKIHVDVLKKNLSNAAEIKKYAKRALKSEEYWLIE